MSKRDVLDERIARQFAWRVDLPEKLQAGDASAVLEDVKKEAPAVDPAEIAEQARYAEERCAELAEEVRKAWALVSFPHQAAATKKLLRLAGRVGFDIVRMDEHPLEAVRLWRLVIRHHQPGNTRQNELFHLSFMPVSERQSEVVDLLLEAAAIADSYIAFLLDQSIEAEEIGRRHPELGERLAELCDNGKTWASKALAARWLSLDEFPAAIPALRRALRAPHIQLRYYAMFILHQMEGQALREEDVLFLLEDAVRHPLPLANGSVGDAVHDYETMLLDILKQIHPKEGYKPLEVIARGGGAYQFRDCGGLGDGWAMKALAAGYPERATTRIDRAMATPSCAWSYDAIEAIGLLPDELARPRLLEAAAHGESHVAERAKAIWFQRFGGSCPFEPLTHVPTELLTDPPSERFYSCLSVLRGASQEARFAMIDALLAEAPESDSEPLELSIRQREALALLLVALRTWGRLYQHPTLGSLSERELALLLLRRFGALAVSGFIAIAEPSALAGVMHGWFDVLVEVARQGKVTAGQTDRLRDIAERALLSPSWDYASGPLIMLSVLKPSVCDLDRLWEIFVAPFEGNLEEDAEEASIRSPRDASRWSAYALQAMNDAPELDLRIAAAAEKALQNRSWDFFDAVLGLAVRRNVVAVFDAAMRAVMAYDGDWDAESTIFHAAQSLKTAGRLGVEWVIEHLNMPQSPLFSIAAHLVDRNASAEIVALLSRHLDSTDRDGATAADAAHTLVWMDRMAGDDPRLLGILARAQLHSKANLCTLLVDWNVPIERYRHFIAECLLSDDRRVTRYLVDSLHCRTPDGTAGLFEELLPKVRDERVKDVMRRVLRAPNEAVLYWADAGEEEEDGDEDDDWEEEEEDEELDG